MAGRYNAYPEYKHSGVKWFGDYPAHWKLWPCRLVNNRMDKNEGAKDQNYLSLMANVGVIRYEDKGDVGNKKPDDLTKCKIVEVGDLVINSMNYAIGSYGMSPYSGVCSPVYIVLRCIDSVVHPRFALRLFENKPFQKHLATFGNGILEHRAAIGWDDIKGSYVPVPPQSEQLRILKFLDHETGKIDALIEKQQALIVLLKEKRQAVISHAVTKGLNPEARMKDSGVEWLGDVPEHWEVISFAQCVSITGGLVDPRVEPFKGYTMIAPNHIESKSGRLLKLETAAEQGAESGKYLCEDGEVIYSKIRPALAKACLCPKDNVLCSADMYPLKGALGLSNSYLFRLVLTDEFTAFTIMESDRVAMPKMNRESLGSTRLPIPPEAEQSDIVRHIETECSKIDKLVGHAELAAQLLQERRTALISAAVTGKIDVRDWEPPKDETG